MGRHFLFHGNLPVPETEPVSPALQADSLLLSHPRKPVIALLPNTHTHVLLQFLQLAKIMGDTLKNQFFPYYISLQAAVCEIPQTTGRYHIAVVVRAGNKLTLYVVSSLQKSCQTAFKDLNIRMPNTIA